MGIKVIPMQWDNDLQMYLEIPLDSADAEQIELARRVNGKQMSNDELYALIYGANTRPHGNGPNASRG